jgi:putative two-component system response regulator
MDLILIVDDEALNRDLMTLVVRSQGWESLAALDGTLALALALERSPDLILLDVLMPGMDGCEVARQLKSNPRTEGIPVVMVSALDDQEARVRGLAAGADDFLSKPVNRIELCTRVRNLLRLKHLRGALAEQAAMLEHRVRQRTDELARSQRDTIHTLIRLAAHKDDESGSHVKRMSMYAGHLAQCLGLDAAFQDQIFFASQLHDVGKIAIPDRILDKPGALNPDEWNTMKTHCALGASMLAQNTSPYVVMAAEIAHAHHESWDGSGYPQGLAGDAIPLAARIVKLADTYDVLRGRRAYKEALDHASAASAILVGDARTRPEHLDPQLLATLRARLTSSGTSSRRCAANRRHAANCANPRRGPARYGHAARKGAAGPAGR